MLESSETSCALSFSLPHVTSVQEDIKRMFSEKNNSQEFICQRLGRKLTTLAAAFTTIMSGGHTCAKQSGACLARPSCI